MPTTDPTDAETLQAMTTTAAIATLNARKHRGHTTWRQYAKTVSPSSMSLEALDEFEAVAIAEKYQRDQPEEPK